MKENSLTLWTLCLNRLLLLYFSPFLPSVYDIAIDSGILFLTHPYLCKSHFSLLLSPWIIWVITILLSQVSSRKCLFLFWTSQHPSSPSAASTTTIMRGDSFRDKWPDLPWEAESVILGSGERVSLELPQNSPILLPIGSKVIKLPITLVITINIHNVFLVKVYIDLY